MKNLVKPPKNHFKPLFGLSEVWDSEFQKTMILKNAQFSKIWGFRATKLVFGMVFHGFSKNWYGFTSGFCINQFENIVNCKNHLKNLHFMIFCEKIHGFWQFLIKNPMSRFHQKNALKPHQIANMVYSMWSKMFFLSPARLLSPYHSPCELQNVLKTIDFTKF